MKPAKESPSNKPRFGSQKTPKKPSFGAQAKKKVAKPSFGSQAKKDEKKQSVTRFLSLSLSLY